MTPPIVDRLRRSDEPSIRWKIRVRVLGEDPDSPAIRRLRKEIGRSARARSLIDGQARLKTSSYGKWQGGHWVLQSLADLGYPSGDPALFPMRDEMLRSLLAKRFFQSYDPETAESRAQAVAIIRGRHRQCASMQGGALFSVVRLGLEDERTDRLAERLLHWQWPESGWNCDRNPEAASPSVHETLLPMRGLIAYADAHEGGHEDGPARAGARKAAEVFLERRLLYRRTNGALINRNWAKLHYPAYWHYDLLAGLKGLAEAGLVDDPRCEAGLDLLQSKELPDGGWPAEAPYYKGFGEPRSSFDHVDWGGADRSRMNEWVTADALAVLAATGRLS